MARSAFEIVLPGGKTVVLVELKSGQLLQAMKAATGAGDGPAAEMAIGFEGLRLSVRKVGARDVSYNDLVGDFLDDLFSSVEIMTLVQAWQSIHFPKKADSESALGKMVARTS